MCTSTVLCMCRSLGHVFIAVLCVVHANWELLAALCSLWPERRLFRDSDYQELHDITPSIKIFIKIP